MANKSIKKNYFYNLIYQVLTLITPLITTPYIARVLEPDGVGKVSFAESIVAYFTLFAALGASTYGQREVSYVQDSKDKLTAVFWNTKLLQAVTSLTAFVIYIIFSFFKRDTSIYLILSFNILAVLVDVTWFFQGMEEFGKIVIRNIFFKIINIVFIFTFVKTKDNLLIYVFGLSFFGFLSNLSLWGYLSKYITKCKKEYLHPFKDIKTVLSLFIPTIAIQIYTVLDKTMIGVLTGSEFENGFYEQAIKLSKMVLMVVTALGTVMIPRIGYFYGKKDLKEIQRLMYRGYRFVWFLGIPLCFGLIMVSDNFVPWFLGDGYDKVTILLKILAFLILAIGINNVTGMQFLIPTKRQNIFTLTVVIGAVTNFTLNLFLIHYFKSVGAAIASVVAEIVIAVVQLIIVRKELSPLRVLKEGINYYFAGLCMFIVLFFVNRFLNPSIINTIIIVIIGGVVYSTILLLLKDEFLVSNIKKIFSIFKRKIKHE